ncbi:MAG: hypothetical protein KDE34_07910, partial [Anaerolineales bacterium]|nr:hypothetical protein [Anaerolineales bacterium]
QSGDYALVVRMSPDIETDRGNYRLVVHEFGPTATIISSRETFTVQAGESSSHLFPALADQPVQVYLHLLSADAELRLNTVSEAGQMTDGGLLVSARVPERLLQWLPREDGQVTLQVNNQGGEAVDYELVILADQTPGREVMAASYPMFADIYTATLTVADDGSVTVVEDVHLTLNEAADTLSWSWDRHQLYRDSISGLILTYEGATCQPQAGDPAAFCQLDATNQTLTLSWPVSAEPGSQHTFHLEYQVPQAVDPALAEFRWVLLPADRAFGIGHATMTVRPNQPWGVTRPYLEAIQGQVVTDGSFFTSEFQVTYLAFQPSRDIPAEQRVVIRIEKEN